jgi:hypothetical protein
MQNEKMTNSSLLSQTTASRMPCCIEEYERIKRREIRDILRKNAAFVPDHHLQHLQAAWPNRLHWVQKQERRKIIMNKIGESVHTDCRQLSKCIALACIGSTYHRAG